MQNQLAGDACGVFDEAGQFKLCPDGQVCAFSDKKNKALCWQELSLMDDKGRQVTELKLEDGSEFKVGKKRPAGQAFVDDIDDQCGCSNAVRPCSNIANILGFVWFGGCCLPESCSR